MIKQLENLGDLSSSSFKELTTLKVGGNIKYLFEPYSIEDLQAALSILHENKTPYKLIGFGSNLLASDDDYEGVVIKLTHIKSFHIKENTVVAEAGLSMIALANKTIQSGLKGLDFACGIPATVGGCIFMNAGAYKASISDVLVRVLVIDDRCQLRWIDSDALNFSYRYSKLQDLPDFVIVAGEFKLRRDNYDDLIKLRNERTQRRMNTQPLGEASCGSVFRNSDDYFAWKVIDRLNKRGQITGGAQVSPKHANFIINKKNALAKDVNDLINDISLAAKNKLGIELELEVERFNWKI